MLCLGYFDYKLFSTRNVLYPLHLYSALTYWHSTLLGVFCPITNEEQNGTSNREQSLSQSCDFLKKASPVLSLHWAKCKSHDNSDHHTQHQRMHSVALSHSPLVLLQDALYSTMGTGLSASLTLFIADIKLPFYTT